MKKIVIMGATSGIGLKTTLRLIQQGHHVGVAGRKVDILKKLKKNYPQQVEWEEIDVTRDDAPKRLLSLIKRLGGMDIYFHTAGVGFLNPELKPDEELATVKVNVVGFTRMIDTAFAYFRKAAQPGHIAAITSVAGNRGIAPMAAYCASKSFGQTYLEALDQLVHNQKLPIKITDLRPGWIRTPLLSPDEDYPMTMQLPYVVPLVIAAFAKRCRVNYIDWRWGLLARAMKLVPGCLWKRMTVQVSTPATHSEQTINAEQEHAGAQV